MSQIGNVGCFKSSNFIFLRLVRKLEMELWVSSENKNLIGCLWNQTLLKLIRGVTVFLRSYGLKENLGLVCSEVPLSPPVSLCLSDSLSSLQSCIFTLSWRGNILSNASIHNLRSFVRSKGKKEWTEAKCVESFNIWGAALYLGQHFCWPLCSTGRKKSESRVIYSRLLSVSQKRLGISMPGRADIFLP